MRSWKEGDDAFEHDPAQRAAATIAKRNMASIRLMKPNKKRRVDNSALGAGEAQCTPEPPSPRLACPRHASMRQ